MTRESWLAERRTGIGSTDIAPILGLSPWRTALEVWMEKRGLLSGERTSPEMQWGLRLEPVIAAAYTEATGRELRQPEMLRHPDHPQLLATIDRLADDRIVELKSARFASGWGEPGTDEVPESYLVQVQGQMLVSGQEVADVAALIGGSDFRIYTVRRHESLIDKIKSTCLDFWQMVESCTPPEPDWTHPSTPELIASIFRPEKGRVVDLGDEHQGLIREYQHLGSLIREMESDRERVKAQLIAAMGDAELGICGDAKIKRAVVQRKAYQVEASEYVSFRITERKS